MTAPVRTNIYTANGRYSISATILEMRGMFMRGEIEQHIFETIRGILMDLEVIDNLHELDDLIDNPRGGYMTLDAFFDEFGQYGINWDSETVFSITSGDSDPVDVAVVDTTTGMDIFYTPDDMQSAFWVLELMREGEIGVFPTSEETIDDDMDDILSTWSENDSIN